MRLLRFPNRNVAAIPDEEVPRAIVLNLDALYATAFRLCGQAALAEDMVQECVKKALHASAGLVHQRQLKAWLFKILINSITDHFRTASRQSEEPFPQDELASVSVEWRSRSVGFDVQRAIEALSMERRAVVLLIDFEGFTIADSAAILSLPAGTVASRLARAHQQLRDLLRCYESGNLSARGEK